MFDRIKNLKRAKTIMEYVSKMRDGELIKNDISLDILKRLDSISQGFETGKLDDWTESEKLNNYVADLKELMKLIEFTDKEGQDKLKKFLKKMRRDYNEFDKTLDKLLGAENG